MRLLSILYTYSFFTQEPMALKPSSASTAACTAMSPGRREFTARGRRLVGMVLSVRKFAQ